MTVSAYGISATPPQGWSVAITRAPSQVGQVLMDGHLTVVEDVAHPILHAATIQLPGERGDFGTGVVDELGSEDVFVSLVEYGHEVANKGLFAPQGFPRLAPAQFDPNQLQRPLPGRSAAQHFFSHGGRAFCLFTVIGAHSRRMATVPKAASMVATIDVTDKQIMMAQGGMP